MDALKNISPLQLATITIKKTDACMNSVDFSKQEILGKETGEQFFWFKDCDADHQALKPGDHVFKGSLPNPTVNWEHGSKSNGTPTLLAFPSYWVRISYLWLYSILKKIINLHLDASKASAVFTTRFCQ